MANRETRENLWRFEAKNLTLAVYDSGGRFVYEVDLERCATAAQTLDSIAQVAGKTYATDMVIADLVRALNDMLGLQPNLCPGGRAKKINVKQVIKGKKIQPVRVRP
jgi:hypothetical protein